jgi:hypothetical protein
MTKKHYKIQSQESYWLEALSLFADGCLNEAETKQHKKYLAKRLADLVKNNCVLDDVMQALPKRLSNTAYLKAKKTRYEDFVKWWDEQV